MKSVCLVTTSPLIVNFFLVPYFAALSGRYRVSLAVNTAEGVALPELPGVRVIPAPIERKISPWRDARALAVLARLFRRERFDAVHSFSPKGGLLSTVAGRLAGVPVRIHTYTGQVWATRRGATRSMLVAADRTIARCATHLLADSPSQCRALTEAGIVPRNRACRVLASGSVSGVDPARFRPDSLARAAVRDELAIDGAAPVIVFLGRLTRDKGVLDLAQAFARVTTTGPAPILLLVGPDEEGMRMGIERSSGPAASRLRFVDYTRAPERYLAAADVLCLPSYREGFGSAIIEAAAAGIPAVGSRIQGITDAIVDNVTGLLHAAGNAAELADRLALLVGDATLRVRLGDAARQRALKDFSQETVASALLAYYRDAIGG